MSDQPREMNRESTRPPRESAKQRAGRIPLPYYRRLTRLDAIKWLLTGVAAAAAGGYVLGTLLGWGSGNERAAEQFSPAPVASVHSTWNGKCAACHVTGASLRPDGQAASLLAATLTGQKPFDHTASDQQCQSCHAGPAHHANQKPEEVWACSACHRDHQGAGADLTRVADAACTRCHADIASHRDDPSRAGRVEHNITSFVTDHPPFDSLKQPPGSLRFNHRLHMLPGQAPKDALDSATKNVAAVDELYARRLQEDGLASVDSKGVITLQCAYCHEPDNAASTANPRSPAVTPASGEYMQPINFERHCAACHNEDLVADAGPLPHGLTAEEARRFLSGLLNPIEGEGKLSPQTPLQPIPGKTPGQNLAQTTQASADVRLAAAERRLRGEDRCGKCHKSDPRADPESVAFMKTEVPSVWLHSARFDHSAHRTVTCFACHEQKLLQMTDDEQGKPLLDEGPPVIPDIENCRHCHAPAAQSGGTGARHDCAECHRYHGAHLAPHGRGAAQRGVPVGQRLEGPAWISPGR